MMKIALNIIKLMKKMKKLNYMVNNALKYNALLLSIGQNYAKKWQYCCIFFAYFCLYNFKNN